MTLPERGKIGPSRRIICRIPTFVTLDPGPILNPDSRFDGAPPMRPSGQPYALPFILGLFLLTASSTLASGFSLRAQGGRAMGLADAVTARIDDPSAIFYNPGGLALSEKKISAGIGVSALNQALYQGLLPGPGAGTASEQEDEMTLPIHAFAAMPIGDRLQVGLGIYSAFEIRSNWANLDTFAGRFISTRAELDTFDINPTVAWKITPNLGLGGGIIYRTAELKLGRRIPGLNPFTGNQVDIASLDMSTDFDAGFGWTAGIQHRLSDRLAWGFSFRSPIEIDFSGTGRLTQIETGNAQLDALVVATFPLDADLIMATHLDFPDTAVAGIALGITEQLHLSFDVEWANWDRFDDLSVDFSDDDRLDTVHRTSFSNVLNYRAGLELATLTGSYYRVGVAFDESPQPAATVGPFLADADRTVVAFGFGREPLDLAFNWISFNQRTITNNSDNINGSYRKSAWVLALTISK